MKNRLIARRLHRGLTLIEMTLVIMVMLALMATGFHASHVYGEWQRARAASEVLRTVYAAQRTYLADNPTTAVTSLTPAMLLPYLPNNPAVFPTTKSLGPSGGMTLYARVNISPPYLTTTAGGTGGTRYDPSKTTTDSLWDVGE